MALIQVRDLVKEFDGQTVLSNINLDLKEGEDIELHMVGARTFEVSKKTGAKELLAQLRQFRGRLPADFHFDRFEANAR